MSKYSPAQRDYQRRYYRRKNGWPDDAIDAPPQPRQCREKLYHNIVELVYNDPVLTVGKVAERLGVNRDAVTNTLTSRRTGIKEIRSEALEAIE